MRRTGSQFRLARRRPETFHPRFSELEDRRLLATLPSGLSEAHLATIGSPTAMEVLPDGRVFVAQQTGALRVVKNDALLTTPFLSLTVDSTGERGLLGVAIDPNFATNQYVFVYYTVPGTPAHNRVSRFTASGDVSAANSELVLLELDNLSTATNHNGGALQFGADGKLYIAVGENATPSHAQTLANLHGKLLRINSDGSIPTDNPFFGTATGNNRAIYALGLRNPFSFAIQAGSGRIFVNDVGQSSFEEVNEAVAGANYGWPIIEGFRTTQTPPANYRDPLYAYGRGEGIAIVGAAFYNPSRPQFPAALYGDYFFADLGAGFIRSMEISSTPVVASGFATGASQPVAIDVADDGAMYYLQRGGSGRLYKITGSVTPPTISNVADQSINEDGSLAATAFTIGDTQSPAHLLSVSATSSHPALVPNTSILLGGSGANRTVAASPVGNQTGSVTITLSVNDGNGGIATDTFVLSVNDVNDRPSFTGGTNQSVFLSAPAEQVVANWASGMSRGPANESSQALQFIVTNNSLPANFTSGPTVDPATGTLRYTLAANATGIAQITLTLADSGGTANGGQDTSLPYTFSIEAQTPWHNGPHSTDVDDSTVTSGIDLIYVVDALNSGLAGPLTTFPAPPLRYLDVNHDNNLSGIDLLLIVDALNQQSNLQLARASAMSLAVDPQEESLHELAFAMNLKSVANDSIPPSALVVERRVASPSITTAADQSTHTSPSRAQLHDLALGSLIEKPREHAEFLPDLGELIDGEPTFDAA